MRRASASVPRMVAFERRGHDSGFYFIDQLRREAKAAADVDLLTGGSYTIRSTVNPALQRATETALQDGLTRYEMNHGRVVFQGAEANLSSAVRRQEAREQNEGAPPAWQKVLARAHLMLYDVHWTPAIIIELANKKTSSPRVGLADGRTLPLTVRVGKAQRALKLYDVVYVKVIDGANKGAARAELRVPPVVQGAALVLENKTGKILAMAGGFSVSAEPAQSDDPGAAPARVRDQALDLSGGVAGGIAAQCTGAGRTDHAAADRWRRARDGEGLLVAEEL